MSQAFDVIQFDSREHWLELRRLGLGGSDAPAVLNSSPWSSAVSVFADKVLGEQRSGEFMGVEGDSEPMYWGRTLEPVILEHYRQETQRQAFIDGRLLRSKEHPFMQVTLDGIQRGPENEVGFVEVKNTRFWLKDGVPEHYWIQMQHQFAVTGWKWGTFAVLVMGSEFYWCDVARDDDFIDKTLVPAERALWERIQNRGPTPSPDASQATLDALKRIYPKDDGETVELDGDFVVMDLDRQAIAAELSALKEQQRGIDNAIKAKLGDATSGVLPSGRTYTWKARKDGVRVLRAPKPEEVV